MAIQTVNPATGEVIEEYEETDVDTVNVRLQMAQDTWQIWSRTGFDERAKRLRTLAGILRDDTCRLAELMTLEMGKPITQARSEIDKCAWVCDFYAEHAEEYLRPRTEDTDAAKSYVRFDSLGAVLAIEPWNFPFWQVFRCAAPGVMAGNVFVLKHASSVTGVAKEIEKLFVRADFPAGVFTTLILDNEYTEKLIAHPGIAAVTLTGSERAGRAVASAAGKGLKPSVLELGGSDPFIVLADADIEEVAAQAAKARCQNSGQSCIAAKRFLVEQPIAGDFQSEFVKAMLAQKMGDPRKDDTDIGPLAREDLRETLHEQVTDSCKRGATVLCGGKPEEGRGYFYPPTVLANVSPGMPVFDEETFGPVAAITTVADRDEAVELANRSPYGLGASIWSSDPDSAEELAPRLEAGCVFINDIVKSDPHLPFGGVKNSGFGRELSQEGIREFVNVKSVWVGRS